MIEVVDFQKAYEQTLAVNRLSFRVDSSQVWGLVGHNGAGKTTTMRAISGLLAPSAGRISIAGLDVTDDGMEARQQIAYLPDDPQLFNALTVAEHLQFTAAAYRLGDYAEEAARLLDYFELAGKAHVAAEDLSRGMRQKLAICCGYLHQPQAILFDEPFTGLDPLAIRRLKQSIHERAARGAAIMVSSHLLAMVEDLCTHFLVLSQGTPTFCGTHEELFEQHGDDATLEEVYFRATELCHDAQQLGATHAESQKETADA